MRKLVGIPFLLYLLVPLASAADNCSCNSPDGTCSASISCAGNCVAICGAGSCIAQCQADSSGRVPFQKGAVDDPFRLDANPTQGTLKLAHCGYEWLNTQESRALMGLALLRENQEK